MTRRTHSHVFALLVACIFLHIGAADAQTIWYVDDDAALGGNGLAWDTAFCHLQDVLWIAVSGDEIRIAGGTYRPDQDEAGLVTPGDRQATFLLVAGTGTYGGYAGLADPNNPDQRDTALYETSLSGDLANNDAPNFVNYDENSYHVVTVPADAAVILDGLTVTACGGGSQYGGGIYIEPLGQLRISDCRIVLNSARYGAGVYSDQGELIMRRCQVMQNDAYEGGGVYSLEGFALVVDCTFHGHLECDRGGGIFNDGGDAWVADCSFTGSTGGYGGGFGLLSELGTTTVLDSVFVGNWGYSYHSTGPAVACVSGEFVLANSTIAGNRLADGGPAVAFYPDVGSIVNCIFWDNEDLSVLTPTAGVVVTYSCMPEQEYDGIGMTHADPRFVRPPDPGPDGYWGTADDDYGDLRLRADSPCIDAGCNWGVPFDVGDRDDDGDTAEYAPFDLDGEDRFSDAPNTADTGCGYPPTVDMGAYEFGGAGQQPCLGDLNGDRAVTLSDLAALLANYGDTSACGGDLDCDGDVELDDLATLLVVYGEVCE